ncbi:hypothetical protein RFI_29915 [Reticulomyxa filosa]|uniref:Uncharacterized protein n=1 Tax=Reticulomyxa filosa TaxID=46433 RepID=X6M1K5_RETFI|nr:hypothetical protein RFI_29915 [Reticulomyxa filosa]|eukprot:ETO07476.1 hypothetical protein RFI_29915 [Reticulomyxa filosa]
MYLQDYVIVCLAGRLNWVPFSHLLKRYSSEMKRKTLRIRKDQNDKKNEAKYMLDPKASVERLRTLLLYGHDLSVITGTHSNNVYHVMTDANGFHYVVFDFENSSYPYHLEFQFSDTTLRKLIELIYLIPFHEGEAGDSIMDLAQKLQFNSSLVQQKKPVVMIDSERQAKGIKYGKPILVLGRHCCEHVHLSALKDLHRAARGRFCSLYCLFVCLFVCLVHLLWKNINWVRVISQSVDLRGYQLRDNIKQLGEVIKMMKARQVDRIDQNPVCHCSKRMQRERVENFDTTMPVACGMCNKKKKKRKIRCEKQEEQRRLEHLQEVYAHRIAEVGNFYTDLVQDGDPYLISTLRDTIMDKETKIHTTVIQHLILQLDLFKHNVLRNFNRIGVYYHTSPELLRILAKRVINFVSRTDWSPSLNLQLQIYMWSAGGFF